MRTTRLSLTVDGEPVEVDALRFPGGEMQVRILREERSAARAARITSYVRSSDDFLATLLLADAVRRHFEGVEIDLVCPYMPYARQDRVAYPGEALAVAVAARLIDAVGFRSVEVWDAHSAVTAQLIRGLTNVPATAFLRGLIAPPAVVVAPDKGAVARASAVAREAGCDLVTAEKIRSTQTGAISHTVVHSERLGDRDCIIVDDICDGGRTFIELAKVLRTLTTGNISLYVTHGIFSNGFETLRAAGIDRILTADSFVPQADLPQWVTIVIKA